MNRTRHESAEVGEKEVAVLGKLVDNLDRLMKLDKPKKNDLQGTKSSTQMEQLRVQLIERIEHLKRR